LKAISNDMPKLYEIPNGSKLRVELQVIGEDEYRLRLCTFHHVDGMYSLCTVDGEDETFHLSVSTPLKLVDGAYEIEE